MEEEWGEEEIDEGVSSKRFAQMKRSYDSKIKQKRNKH